jgi:hypothetical protein
MPLASASLAVSFWLWIFSCSHTTCDRTQTMVEHKGWAGLAQSWIATPNPCTCAVQRPAVAQHGISMLYLECCANLLLTSCD